MPAGGVKKMARADMMSEDETITAIEAAVGLGVFKLRITGGEPLVAAAEKIPVGMVLSAHDRSPPEPLRAEGYNQRPPPTFPLSD